jgi:hypothetical protein
MYTSFYLSKSNAGKEVFRAVWKELNVSLAGVAKNVDSVADIWMCPPFCECKRAGGQMLSQHINAEDKHYVDYDEFGGAPK